MARMTFTAGVDALASQVNTYLMDQAVQTYADAATRNSALPTPSEGQLTYLSDLNQYQTYTGSTWAAAGGVMPFIHYNHTGSQSITTSNETNINAWTQVETRGITTVTDYFTNSAGVITLVKAGFYQIQAQVNYATNSTGIRSLGFSVSGTTYGRTVSPTYTLTGQTLVQFSWTGAALAGDTIQLATAQTSGGNLTLTGNTRLKITYLGA